MSDTAFRIISYTDSFTDVARAAKTPDSGRPTGPSLAGRALAWLLEAHRRRLSRLLISELDCHMLRDIGVSFAEAEAEANKPWWRG